MRLREIELPVNKNSTFKALEDAELILLISSPYMGRSNHIAGIRLLLVDSGWGSA